MYIKIKSLNSDIEKYWISCATDLRSFDDDSMRKGIDAWSLNIEMIKGY